MWGLVARVLAGAAVVGTGVVIAKKVSEKSAKSKVNDTSPKHRLSPPTIEQQHAPVTASSKKKSSKVGLFAVIGGLLAGGGYVAVKANLLPTAVKVSTTASKAAGTIIVGTGVACAALNQYNTQTLGTNQTARARYNALKAECELERKN
jgi:hypothetical protein